MSDFLSARLFRVGETPVTVSSLLLSLAILVASFVLSRIVRSFVANRMLGRTRLAEGSRYAIGRVLGYVVLRDPPPRVWFREFGDSSLQFELLCWTSKLLHSAGTFRSELNHLIYDALTERGIRIPFPQRDVHIRGGTEGAASGPRGQS